MEEAIRNEERKHGISFVSSRSCGGKMTIDGYKVSKKSVQPDSRRRVWREREKSEVAFGRWN